MTKKFNCFLDSKYILSSAGVLMAFRKVSKEKKEKAEEMAPSGSRCSHVLLLLACSLFEAKLAYVPGSS